MFGKKTPERRLVELKKKAEENLDFYGMRVSQMVRRAFPGIDDINIDGMSLSYFVKGLHRDIEWRVKGRNPVSLQKVIKYAKQNEAEGLGKPKPAKEKQEKLLVTLETVPSENVVKRPNETAPWLKEQYVKIQEEMKNLKQIREEDYDLLNFNVNEESTEKDPTEQERVGGEAERRKRLFYLKLVKPENTHNLIHTIETGNSLTKSCLLSRTGVTERK
ncbi:hypothetical protein BpHYR1_029614, partial [Brachionus plicatilis]